MLFQIIMFCLGLVLLVWGSSLFVDSAVDLANYLNLPEVLIGATVVSLGTTLPEVLFSTMASAKGLSDMALGNAIGSILCNTGFIAGLLILLRPVVLNTKEIRNIFSGTLFLSISIFIYFFCGITLGRLTSSAGILLLIICVLYIKNTAINPAMQEIDNSPYSSAGSFGISDIIRLILEIAALYFGAGILVKFGPELALSFGVPKIIISLTLVALGTSLPELVTSLVSLKKKHSSISLGNIIGADILNFLLVGGISSAIHPIVFPPKMLTQELPFAFLLLSLLCIPSVRYKKTNRFQGLVLLSGYALYLFLLSA